MVGLILTILSWFVVGRSTAAPAPANTAGTMGPQATDPSQAPVQSATSDGRLTRRRPELRRCEVAMVPGMRESPLDQAKRAYRQDNPKEAVDLTGERFGGRRRQASFWRTPRTVGAEVSQPECTRTMERGSSRAGRRSGSQHQRRSSGESVMHKGYLLGWLARYNESWSLLHQAEQAARELGLRALLGEVLWRRGASRKSRGLAKVSAHIANSFPPVYRCPCQRAKRESSSRRPRPAVGSGGCDGTAAADRRAKFEANHS